MRTSRRSFIRTSAVVGAGALVPRAWWMPRLAAAQSPQIPMAGAAIPKFVDPLPGLLTDLGLIDATAGTGPLGTSQIVLNMAEFQAQVLPTGMPKTWVWGYLQDGQAGRSTYLGPIILARRGYPVEMKFVNGLAYADATNVLAYKYGTDQTLDWADPLNAEANFWNKVTAPPPPGSEGALNYSGPIPACVHLHGGEVPPQLDGGPDAWYTGVPPGVGLAYQAYNFYSADGTGPAAAGGHSIYRYPNSQEGSPIWFHDHTLGATRLNVYCGLAGGYLVLDPANDPPFAPDPNGLPWPPVPLIIQDRMFDTNGQLFFPADSAANLLWTPNPEHPYWVPEFVGDVICVNGKAWPYLNVEPRRYTFLFLNGSNARSYEMFLIDPVSGNRGPAFWVIGTDGGYLDKPVRVGPPAANNNNLVMMGGERYMVIVDFAGYQAGVIGPNGVPYSGNWLLKNQAKTPFPNGAAAVGATTAQIMQFRVAGTPGADSTFNPAAAGATLRGGTGQGPAVVRLVNPVTGQLATTAHLTRQLTLNEVMGMPQNAINPVTGLMTAYPGGPLEILVNNTKLRGERVAGVEIDALTGLEVYKMEARPDFIMDSSGKNYVSELPKEGETEVWEIINLTADAHPIHLHLVQFQLMNRQAFDTKAYNAAYAAAFPGGGYDPLTNGPYAAGVYIPGFGPPLTYSPGAGRPAWGGNPDVNALAGKKPLYLKGTPTPPLPQEAGWKDTVIVYPGQVTRIVVRWAPTDIPAGTTPTSANFPFDPSGGDAGHGYVWHCHIVDHEDNEMMRPDEVIPNVGVTRTYVKGVDY